MGKSALLFAGQGRQYVGMGKELYDNFEKARSAFDIADQVLNNNIKKICFEGPKEELDQTINTQPAVFTFNMAVYNTLSSKLKPDFIGGHSLGEVCAAVACQSLSLEQGLAIVQMRAKLMQKAASQINGSMIAVIGLGSEEIAFLIKDIEGLYMSNFNSPQQTTISGPKDELEKAKDILKNKARTVVDLAVSGAFHSPYMQEAADEYSKYLSNIDFSDAQTSLIANFDANPKSWGSEIKNALVKQIASPVQFVKMLEHLSKQGVDTFIEIGPGKTLANLIKRTVPQSTTYTTDTIENMESFLELVWS